MKTIINVVLVLLSLIFIFLLYISIKDPLEFAAARDTRVKSVVDRLKTIRECQEMYRDIYGTYASTFEQLSTGLNSGRFRNIKVNGDPDDPNFTGKITYDTIYESAADSIKRMGLNLDSLAFVPYGNGTRFDMQTDTIMQGQIQVDVLQCGIPKKTFMGKYADPTYKKYDNSYNPDALLKFGDLNSPNMAGNWEGK